MRRWTAVGLLVLTCSFAAPGRTESAEVVGLVAVERVLSELDRTFKQAITAADTAAANRLRDFQTRSEELLRQVDAIRKGAVADVNKALTEATISTHKLAADLHAEMRQHERQAFLDVNTTLVNLSATIDALPIVDVQPYVFAVQPTRLKADATDRQVFVYGYFKEAHKTPAKVQVGGLTLNMFRWTNNRLSFALPSGVALTENTFVLLDLVIPYKSGLFGMKKELNVQDRIFVERREPYEFTAKAAITNPDLWVEIQAPGEAHWGASDSRPTEQQNLSAKTLFSSMVPDAGSYEIESAQFVRMDHREGVGTPCEHAPATAQFVGWSPHHVEFRLTASSVGYHCHSPFDCRGGGGSNADIWLRPVFRVRRLHTPPTVDAAPLSRRAKRSDLVQFELPDAWERVEVVGHFSEADDHWSQPLVLETTRPTAAERAWMARVDGKVLTIQTIR